MAKKTASAEKTKGSDSDSDLLKEALDRYTRGYDKDRCNIDAAYEDLQFMTGRTEDQWPPEAIKAREAEGRPILTTPLVAKFCAQVTGDMRLSKPGIKVVPVDNQGDQETAEVLAGMVRYIETRSSARIAYTKAADSQVACGIGHWRVTTEYADATTFNQEIRIVAVDDGVATVWDPDAILPTREDAQFCFEPVDISETRFKELYPDASPSDYGSIWHGWAEGEMVRIARYWYKKPEKRLVALFQDGSVVDLTDKPEEAQKAKNDPTVRIESRDSHCIYHALICAGHVLEKPKKWPGRYIPVIPVIGVETYIGSETYRRGLVRHMKDTQRLYNYALSAQAEITALQPKSPFVATEENVEDYLPEWEAANSQNKAVLLYKPDQKNGGVPPQRVQPPVSSQGIAELIDRAKQDLKEVTGIFDAGLGNQSNETSGKAIAARQREADVGTFVYMDNWSLSIEYTGRILIDLIPHIYDTQRAIRIVGEDGKMERVDINQTVQAPMFEDEQPVIKNDVTVGSYDVVLETGPAYSTRREEAKEGMIEFLRSQPDVGPIIADLVAKSQDWPLADEIAERLEMMLPAPIRQMLDEKKKPEDRKPPQPPPSEEEQLAMRLELEDKAADVGKKKADAQDKTASAETKAFDLQLKQMQVAGAMAYPQAINPVPQEDPRQEQMMQAIQMIAEAVAQNSQQMAQISQALGLNQPA